MSPQCNIVEYEIEKNNILKNELGYFSMIFKNGEIIVFHLRKKEKKKK